MVLGTSGVYDLFLGCSTLYAAAWEKDFPLVAAAFCGCAVAVGSDKRTGESKMNETAIKIERISKKYQLYDKPLDRLKEALHIGGRKQYHQEYEALSDVDLSVLVGETVGIIGTNGSGKSTLLKIITGVLQATGGTVVVNGRVSALLELGAGFNMEYTGIENVYLNGTMTGFSKEEIDLKLDAILEFADIGEFINQPVKTYSSGMFVRLAFAVAINIDPEILIVDEALSVGDVFFQAKCYKKFEEFKKQGKTILIVSHDLGSVSKYCDKVMVLHKGKKLAEGKPKKMIDLYKKLLVGQTANTTSSKSGRAYTPEWKQQMQLNPKVSSYGNAAAEIYDYCTVNEQHLITGILQKGELFVIKMRVKFHQDVSEPIFAFTIKDSRGTEITGTNTMYEQVFFADPKCGETRQVTFTQEMNLQGGEYLVSLGCTGYHDGTFDVYHRLYDAFSITVVSDKNTVGYYDMNSRIEISPETGRSMV